MARVWGDRLVHITINLNVIYTCLNELHKAWYLLFYNYTIILKIRVGELKIWFDLSSDQSLANFELISKYPALRDETEASTNCSVAHQH